MISACFPALAFVFPRVPSKMSFASIQLSVRMMSQCFDPLKLNLFCHFDCAENRLNNASDVSTYGCLCGRATSFSKTSVVKNPREED